jgi:hypothetical protein
MTTDHKYLDLYGDAEKYKFFWQQSYKANSAIELLLVKLFIYEGITFKIVNNSLTTKKNETAHLIIRYEKDCRKMRLYNLQTKKVSFLTLETEEIISRLDCQ